MRLSVFLQKNKVKSSPKAWSDNISATECSLHQLSPYIGKLKSKIAYDLIVNFSNPGDLIFDPFSGSGTIPLEAIINNRRTIASDISLYSEVLTKAKLFPPSSFDDACEKADNLIKKAYNLQSPDLRKVPAWVRRFFHPETLKEAINFSIVCKNGGNEFFLACFLGILHHQRPGFLSYPSSHLVPYLRTKIYPKDQYPELYEYRDLRTRLFAKIKRAFSRLSGFESIKNINDRTVYCKPVEKLRLTSKFDCLITSPPYMNALDYIRDNRLRLWFADEKKFSKIKKEPTAKKDSFEKMVTSLSLLLENKLSSKGHAILIVGENITKRPNFNLSQYLSSAIALKCPSMQLIEIIEDLIPDIRRSRRDCKGTKKEHILVFKKR